MAMAHWVARSLNFCRVAIKSSLFSLVSLLLVLLGINYIGWFSVSCGFDGFCLFVGFPLLLGRFFFFGRKREESNGR